MSLTLELAVINVMANGPRQDEAAEIVSSLGGRLISLHEAGFTAQVTHRPDAIDAMLARLTRVVDIEVNRSGAIEIQTV
jgi:acetolactate synthase small subunit